MAQSSRIDGKVKQRAVLYLGSEVLLENKNNRAVVLEILKAKIFGQNDLFPVNAQEELKELALSYYQKYCIKYGDEIPETTSIPPAPEKANYEKVDFNTLEVDQVKTFGADG